MVPPHPLLNHKNDAMDLDLDIECHSEPAMTRCMQPKSGLVSKPLTFTGHSKLPDVATASILDKTHAICKPLQPSTSGSLVDQVIKMRPVDSKRFPLQKQVNSSSPITLVQEGKLATMKKLQVKGVVGTVRLAQPKQINSSSLYVLLPKPNPQLSSNAKAPIITASAPIQAVTTVHKTSTISIMPKKSRSFQISTMNGSTPRSIEPAEKDEKLKKARIENELSLTTTPFKIHGSSVSTKDHHLSTQVQEKPRSPLDDKREPKVNFGGTALQWHHPCSDAAIRVHHAEDKPTVSGELDVKPEEENVQSIDKMVSFPIASHTFESDNPSQNFSPFQEHEIPKDGVEDKTEMDCTEIENIEIKESSIIGYPLSLEACSPKTGTGSFKRRNSSSADFPGHLIPQIQVEWSSEKESTVQHTPVNSGAESSVRHIQGLRVDDDASMTSQSSQNTTSAEEKPISPVDSLENIAEIDIIKNDLWSQIINHSSVHSFKEAALQCHSQSIKGLGIKTESLPDSKCQVPSFMGNPENTEISDRHTSCPEVLCSENVLGTCIADNVSTVTMNSHDLENPSSSAADDMMNDKNHNEFEPARPTYPSTKLKWNVKNIHKIQLQLTRQLKKKEQCQINPTKDANQHDEGVQDPPSSSSNREQEGSSIVELLVPNVLQDCIIRKAVQDSYSEGLIPSIKIIHNACCKSGLDVSDESIQPYLKSLGFDWVTCDSGKLLVEDPRFTARRMEYLDHIGACSDKNLVYLFVSDLVGRAETSWQTYSYTDRAALYLDGVELHVVLHAISNTRLIDGSLLMLEIDQSGLNTNQIREWLESVVLPKIPKGSAVIIGDAIFELTQEVEDRPHMGYSKAEIISWLKYHNIKSGNPNLPKAVLLSKAYEAVLQKSSIFDKTIQQNGFETFYLPKHHRDLNPMEFLWQDILDKLRKSLGVENTDAFKHFVALEFSFCSQMVSSVAWNIVKKFEVAYRDFDVRFDELFDSMTSIVGPVSAGTSKKLPAKNPRISKPASNHPPKTTKLETQDKCPVCRCEKTVKGNFRCLKCKSFWNGLISSFKNGKELPFCSMTKHVPTRPHFCRGCRRHQYELFLLRTYPNKALPIPPVTSKGEEQANLSHTRPMLKTQRRSFAI